ncbi:MAG: hypothetical protein NTZ05_01165 [Chloroflexi bacterium]|nr:hypothetical protein [Chloroflexota bacterium]
MLQRIRWMAGLALTAIMAFMMTAGVALAEPPNPPTGGRPAERKYGDEFVTRLAAQLNVSKDVLQRSMRQAADDTIDEAVKNGDLTQGQAMTLKRRIQRGHYGAMFGAQNEQVGPLANAHGVVDNKVLIGAAAQQLGVAATQLRQQLDSGRTLRDLAMERGITEQSVKAAMTEAARTRLAQGVQSGKISQQQADQVVAGIQNADLSKAQEWLTESDQGGAQTPQSGTGQEGGFQQTPTQPGAGSEPGGSAPSGADQYSK